MHSEFPLVSVAITVYNAEAFIRETLDSVLVQDYPNFEIKISDDASTDATPKILKEYQKRYSEKIDVIFNPVNQGVTTNCDIALKAGKGKYIALLAGDDLMLPGKLSAQVKMMEANPNCIICHHDLEAFNHDTKETLWCKRDRYITKNLTIKHFLRRGNQLIACEIMVRRDALPADGYNKKFPWVADFVLFFEMLANNPNGQICYVDQVLGKYRIHTQSATGRNDLQKRKTFLFDSLNFYNWVLLYYPQYTNHAAYFFSKTIRGQVAKLPGISYPKMQILSLRIKLNYQSIVGLLTYYLSGGRIKL